MRDLTADMVDAVVWCGVERNALGGFGNVIGIEVLGEGI